MARVKSEPDTVYVLEDDAGRIRYVGVTADASKRLGRHIRESRRSDTRRATWIRSMLAAGKMPSLRVVESGVADWREAECRWVAKCRIEGCDLVNGTDGGEAVPERMKSGAATYPYVRELMKQIGSGCARRSGGKVLALLGEDAAESMDKRADEARAAVRSCRRAGRMEALEAGVRHLFESRGWSLLNG